MIIVTANEFQKKLTEWRRARNEKFRAMMRMGHGEFICEMFKDRKGMEEMMDTVLPMEMHSSTMPVFDANDYKYMEQ